MQSAIERRQQVLEAISDRRTERIENLASEFGVSRRTIERDILVLSCSYPIVTVQGAAGGVRAMDGWYVTRRYLNDDQEGSASLPPPRTAAGSAGNDAAYPFRLR